MIPDPQGLLDRLANQAFPVTVDPADHQARTGRVAAVLPVKKETQDHLGPKVDLEGMLPEQEQGRLETQVLKAPLVSLDRTVSLGPRVRVVPRPNLAMTRSIALVLRGLSTV